MPSGYVSKLRFKAPFQSSQRKSFQHAGAQEHEQVLGFAGTSCGTAAWKRVDGQPMANALRGTRIQVCKSVDSKGLCALCLCTLVDSIGLLLMPMVPTVYVSKLSFKAQSGRLSLCVLQLIAKHRSTGRFASICAVKHVHTDVHYSATYSTDARLLRTSSQDILARPASPTDVLATDALAAMSTSS